MGGAGERSEPRVGGVASEASGGGAAGRPRIVAEGDVLRVLDNDRLDSTIYKYEQ